MHKLSIDEFFETQEQTVGVEPRVPQCAYPEHTHDFNEIVIVTSGKGMHILNGRPYELYPRMVCYIKASDHHLYDNVDDLHLMNILYRSTNSFTILNNIEPLLPDRQHETQTHWCLDKPSHQRIQALLANLTHVNNDGNLQQESAFLQLLLLLKNGRYSDHGIGNNQDKVHQLLQWLQHHFSEPIDWTALSEQFSLSVRTLHRHIKQDTGYTPQAYLTKLRLAEAYYQLRYTDKNITMIALDCGFNDSAYFSTCFKAEFMITPRELRNSSSKTS